MNIQAIDDKMIGMVSDISVKDNALAGGSKEPFSEAQNEEKEHYFVIPNVIHSKGIQPHIFRPAEAAYQF